MPDTQRDPELMRLARDLVVQFKAVYSPDGKTSYVDVFYTLLERDIIEVGPGLFR